MAEADPAPPHVGESALGESRIAPEANLSTSPGRTFQPHRHSWKKEGKTAFSPESVSVLISGFVSSIRTMLFAIGEKILEGLIRTH